MVSVSSKLLPHPSSSPLLTTSTSSNDDVLRYIKGLQLKVEAVEAQRKKDLRMAEAQRKKDIKKVERRAKKTIDL